MQDVAAAGSRLGPAGIRGQVGLGEAEDGLERICAASLTTQAELADAGTVALPGNGVMIGAQRASWFQISRDFIA